jgi:hypothetical protein
MALFFQSKDLMKAIISHSSAPVVCSPTMIQCHPTHLVPSVSYRAVSSSMQTQYSAKPSLFYPRLSTRLRHAAQLGFFPVCLALEGGLLEGPTSVLEDLFLLLFPRVVLHRPVLLSVLAVLAVQLLALLCCGSPDGPVQLAEDVGLDGCVERQTHGMLQSDARPTINTVRAQDVRALCPPARRTLVQ